MLQGTSKELQRISIVAFMHDPYLFSKCLTVVKEDFYENKDLRLIFRALSSYYKKYMVLPKEDELNLLLTEIHTEDYGDINEITSLSSKLINTDVSSEEYVEEKVIEFIRRCNIEKSLDKVVKYMESGKIDLDQVSNDLRDSININFSRNPVYNLSDVTKIGEVKEEALGSNSPVMIRFFINSVNSCMQYGAFPPGTLNMIVAPPGRGKTTLLINQGLFAAQQGFNTLHVFLGDMSKYDGLIRYLSCKTGAPSRSLVDLGTEELESFVRKHNMDGALSKVFVASYAADELSANQLIEEITSLQKSCGVHFDQIIVDYDENLSSEADSMYASGGQIYNKMALFAVINKTVVFIASQPKTLYWNQEIIPLEGASESSKKQKIIDFMGCLGRQHKQSSVGTFYIAKNRRGEDCKIFRIALDGSNARIRHITEDEYNATRQKEKISDSKED